MSLSQLKTSLISQAKIDTITIEYKCEIGQISLRIPTLFVFHFSLCCAVCKKNKKNREKDTERR